MTSEASTFADKIVAFTFEASDDQLADHEKLFQESRARNSARHDASALSTQ